MKIKLIFLFSIFRSLAFTQTCTALFTYSASGEIVTFSNLSTAANAHYYWDFGNGSSSSYMEPIHRYFDNGNYLVTLYVLDTVTRCSDFEEHWLTVTRQGNDPCSPFLRDSIYFQNNAHVIEFKPPNTNCPNGNAAWYTCFWKNWPMTNTFTIPSGQANLVSAGRYGNNPIFRMATKTTTLNFDKAKNYGPCSANFEYHVVSENASGQTIFYEAMNKNAASYQWSANGNNIPWQGTLSTRDTITLYYLDGGAYNDIPYGSMPSNVFLRIQEFNGCTDSLWQSVVLRPKSYTTSLNTVSTGLRKLNVYPNPAKEKLNIEIDEPNFQIDELSVNNSLGQSLLVIKKPSSVCDIDIHFLVEGFYYVNIKSRLNEAVVKFMKE
jgi:PKD repeat protein